MLRQQHVVADHLQVARASHLAQREPDFQRPEAPRILRAVVEVIQDLIVEVVVASGDTRTRGAARSASRTSTQPASSGA